MASSHLHNVIKRHLNSDDPTIDELLADIQVKCSAQTVEVLNQIACGFIAQDPFDEAERDRAIRYFEICARIVKEDILSIHALEYRARTGYFRDKGVLVYESLLKAIAPAPGSFDLLVDESDDPIYRVCAMNLLETYHRAGWGLITRTTLEHEQIENADACDPQASTLTTCTKIAGGRHDTGAMPLRLPAVLLKPVRWALRPRFVHRILYSTITCVLSAYIATRMSHRSVDRPAPIIVPSTQIVGRVGLSDEIDWNASLDLDLIRGLVQNGLPPGVDLDDVAQISIDGLRSDDPPYRDVILESYSNDLTAVNWRLVREIMANLADPEAFCMMDLETGYAAFKALTALRKAVRESEHYRPYYERHERSIALASESEECECTAPFQQAYRGRLNWPV